MRYLYTFILTAALPFVLLRLYWRSLKQMGYRKNWSERFANIKAIPANDKVIWLHAVSVGEVIAATPLIKNILKKYPQHHLVITTTTPTGRAQVQQRFGDAVISLYLPYDLPLIVKRFLKRIHPEIAIIMETELWPNLLYYTAKRHIPLLLANARLSLRSMKGYQHIASLTEQMLQNFTNIAAQSDLDGSHFLQLGANPDKLFISGNIKFDLQLPEGIQQKGLQLKHDYGNRPTFIAASTHETEEEVILDAFKNIQQQHPNTLLILVPRHPDRFNKVAKLCKSHGFTVARRSLKQMPTIDTSIMLGDTMGEMMLFYAASDVAFVAGSLCQVGGHNLIEPAALKLPLLTGPNLHNFEAISELLKKANALKIVDNATDIASAVNELFNDETQRIALGQRALAVSESNTGALKRHLQWISCHLNNP